MKSGIFVLMATMVATNVYAVESRVGKMLPGVCGKLTGDAKDACLKQAGYTTETAAVLEARLGDAEKRLHDVECREADAAEAVKACGAGKTFAERLKKCIGRMADVQRAKKEAAEAKRAVADLRAKVAEHDKVLADHTRRLSNVEAVAAGHDLVLEEHAAGFNEVGKEIDELQVRVSGGLAGWATVSRSAGMGPTLTASFDAGENRRFDLTVAAGFDANRGLGYALGVRYRSDGDGSFYGANASLIGSNKGVLKGRAATIGAGPSFGYTADRFTVTVDGVIGAGGIRHKNGLDGGAVLSFQYRF